MPYKEAEMKITVVISVYNAQDTIFLCLESLAQQEVMPYEVICVNNNSSDKSLEIIKQCIEKFRYLTIKVINEHKIGPAAARNKGIGIARGELIAFMDADCLAKKDWVKNIYIVFKNDPLLDGVGGVEGGLFSGQLSVIGKFLSAFWLAPSGQLRRSIISDKMAWLRNNYIATFNCVYTKQFLTENKSFDESFYPTGEDFDLWMRALDRKAKIVSWESSLVVLHLQSISLRKMLRKSFIYGDALSHLAKKHFSKRFIIQIPGWKQYNFNFPLGPIVISRSFVKVFLLFSIVILSSLISLFATFAFLILLSIFYFLKIRKFIDQRGYKISFFENIYLVFVFFSKELVEVVGHIVGALKYRVFCI